MRSIRWFFAPAEVGRRGKSRRSAEPQWFKAGVDTSVSESRAGGPWPSVREDVARSTCPAWGARVRRRTRPVPISTGYPSKTRNAKSSTTRGPSRHGVKGLPVSSTEDDAEQGKPAVDG